MHLIDLRNFHSLRTLRNGLGLVGACHHWVGKREKHDDDDDDDDDDEK